MNPSMARKKDLRLVDRIAREEGLPLETARPQEGVA
jgi:hypothetical protein